ncbi:hypothetical protein [Streptomyces sp. MS2.AVA.5]|uniref:Uncharacterized protein n=1 Tax=Streptomyces achmelvichensis TaxID=3134111 RepID=A0ACC6Q9D4_9ACTN
MSAPSPADSAHRPAATEPEPTRSPADTPADSCPSCRTRHPATISQCEGCPNPLASYATTDDNGCITVRWKMCPTHDALF